MLDAAVSAAAGDLDTAAQLVAVRPAAMPHAQTALTRLGGLAVARTLLEEERLEGKPLLDGNTLAAYRDALSVLRVGAMTAGLLDRPEREGIVAVQDAVAAAITDHFPTPRHLRIADGPSHTPLT